MKNRTTTPAALALALLLPVQGFAANFGSKGIPSVAASVNTPAVITGVPQFNTWLVGMNQTLNLPAQDLAAISLNAANTVGAGAQMTVRYDAAQGKIELVPVARAKANDGIPELNPVLKPVASGVSASISLSNLPQMREELARSGATAHEWVKMLSAVKTPADLELALNAHFDGTTAKAAASFDPQQHTVKVLSNTLPEHVRPASDAGARARQQKALLDWHNSKEKTYVLVNSYSFKDDGTPGLNYYDMRPLAQILWAAEPGTNIIFVTAMPVDESMVQHVLRSLPNADEVRKRIHFVSLNDGGSDFLSQKLLDDKHKGALRKIKQTMEHIGSPTVLLPYMGGPYEWQIAKELGIPDSVYAAHPTMFYWGSKSGGRKVFKDAMKTYRGTKKVRIKLAEGAEDVYNVDAAALGVEALLKKHPDAKKVAVKLNLGSSGEGNLFPDVAGWGALTHEERRRLLQEKLDAAKVGIPDETGHIDSFAEIMAKEGAAIEQFIPGIDRATFPSVQSEILPDGSVRILSSHEQILVDRNNYVGATLSADKRYRKAVERAAYEAAKQLAARGIVGRFGTDFAAVPQDDGTWDIYYIENNIRLTGTTHPLVAASGLTGASYKGGKLRNSDAKGSVRYKSNDHDVRPNLTGLDVDGFLSHFDKDENKDVLFDPERRSGVLFHLLPAVKAAGNVGYTIIASSQKAVQAIQDRLTASLNRLELEYLTGQGAETLKTRNAAHDEREQLDEQYGHVNTVRQFKAFLQDNGKDLLKKGGKTGIVFHPHGYTVVGADAADVTRLDRAAQGLLARFAVSMRR
jgi:hypothetical protein